MVSVSQSRGAFEQEIRILQRVLSQRSEQHEAVLSSLIALENSKVAKTTLADFANQMRSRYPQIELIENCTIPVQKKFSCSRFNPSNLEPTLAQQALDATLKLDLAQPVAVSSFFKNFPEHPRFVLSQATKKSVFIVWIDANRYVNPQEFSKDVNLELRTSLAGNILFQRLGTLAQANLPLPQFQLTKTLGSSFQPFVLSAKRQFQTRELPLLWMTFFLLTGAILSWWLARVLLLTRVAQLERVKAELALGHERARAQGTVQAVSESLVTCDRNGKITLLNPAAEKLLVLEASTGLGRDMSQVLNFRATLGGQPLGTFLANFWQKPQVMDLPEGTTLLSGDQQAILVEGSLSPLYDLQGQLAGAVLACHALGSFRKRMLEALEQSERRVREHEAMLAHVGRVSTLSEIAAGIAHELNQPLTAILSQNQASLRLLEEEDQTNHSLIRRSLNASAEQARRASQILERLRAHVSQQPLQCERIDLHQLIENVRVLTEHELLERGIRLEKHLEAGLLEVEGDSIQLEQVLHNLVRNAIEAVAGLNPDQKIIQILGVKYANTIQIKVRDFGHGISPEVLPGLFTPFVSSKKSGLGLGLSLSQTLAQSMGGQLTGENIDSSGACFTLTLPALASEMTYAPV